MPNQSFNFRPFERTVANAPIGAFSSLLGQRLEQFKQGELITDQAKEVFGNLEVAQEDQVLRNQIADDLNNNLDGLLEQYEGGYESIQFQRDAKKLIRDAARNPALQSMQQTLGEVRFEEELRREAAKNPSIVLYDFKPQEAKNTTFDETSGYSSYRTGLETAQDHRADARKFLGTLIPDTGTGKPTVEDIAGLKAIVQGSWKEHSREKTVTRVEETVDFFADSSTGGNQMARKFAFDNQLGSIRNEDGSLKKEVASFLSKYLINVAADREFRSDNVDYSFPSFLNKEDPVTNPNNFGTEYDAFTDTVSNKFDSEKYKAFGTAIPTFGLKYYKNDPNDPSRAVKLDKTQFEQQQRGLSDQEKSQQGFRAQEEEVTRNVLTDFDEEELSFIKRTSENLFNLKDFDTADFGTQRNAINLIGDYMENLPDHIATSYSPVVADEMTASDKIIDRNISGRMIYDVEEAEVISGLDFEKEIVGSGKDREKIEVIGRYSADNPWVDLTGDSRFTLSKKVRVGDKYYVATESLPKQVQGSQEFLTALTISDITKAKRTGIPSRISAMEDSKDIEEATSTYNPISQMYIVKYKYTNGTERTVTGRNITELRKNAIQ